MDYDITVFATAGAWVSLLTLAILEVILGVDNIIFISLVAGRLPADQQAKARNIGLMIALLFRVGLLLSISWIIGLTAPIFTLPLESVFADMGVHDAAAAAVAARTAQRGRVDLGHHRRQRGALPQGDDG